MAVIRFSFFLLLALANLTLQLSTDEFLSVTKDQKAKLDELYHRVKDKVVLDWMREPVFLITFLRANDFNLKAAEENILNFVRWRKDNDVDNILFEDFPEYDQEYRVIFEGCDRANNPVISLPIGDWDFRRVAISGKGKHFIRYVQKILEEGTGFLRWAQKEGFEMTQATIIMDLKGLATSTHICAGCIPMYLQLLPFAQNFYGGFAHKIHVVNAPDYALPIWALYKSLINSHISNILEVHGMQKTAYTRRLAKDIDPSALNRRYGGNKIDGLDLSTLRSAGPKGFMADPPFLDLKARNITSFCGVDWNYVDNLIGEIWPNKVKRDSN